MTSIAVVFGKVYVIANFSRTRRILDILYSAQHGNHLLELSTMTMLLESR